MSEWGGLYVRATQSLYTDDESSENNNNIVVKVPTTMFQNDDKTAIN